MQDYWRSRLSQKDKNLYDQLIASFVRHEEYVSCGNASSKSVMAAYEAISYDHPELYQLPYNPEILQTIFAFNTKTELVIKSIFSSSMINQFDNELARLRSELIQKLNYQKSTIDKEKTICEYIIENTTYEINYALNQNSATVLLKHKGQCSGIAKAVKMLLDWAGIESIIINGTASNEKGITGPHSWNIVKIEDTFYHLDATFMLGANPEKKKPFRLLYLNYSDEQIKINHSWDTQKFPLCPVGISSEEIREQKKESAFCGMQIYSLYEFRQVLKNAIMNGNAKLEFDSKIPISSDRLLKALERATSETVESLKSNLIINISLRGTVASLTWECYE